MKKKILIFFILSLSLAYFFYFQNNSIVTTEYNIQSDNIPESFHDYKIVQLSDLHSKSFGKNQSKLIKRIMKINTNLIVFTGDLVDSKNYNEENSLLLIEELMKIAPVYFVTGNHEWWAGTFDSLESKLNKLGVHVLRNTVRVIDNGRDRIHIIGIDDPEISTKSFSDKELVEKTLKDSIQEIKEDISFSVLLSHRPELFTLYSHFNFDLVLVGHAHGGQFRIPIIGGVVAPNQGFFPKYYSGKYELNNTKMIVNRGLGNSIIPVRLFNRPEIVVVTLKSDE